VRDLFVNYRHAFHAGSFADVVKHVVLCRVLDYLRVKPAPFRVIDIHAGGGLYDLAGTDARRGGEWRDGIGRVWQQPFAPPVEALLAPYRAALTEFNAGDTLRRYPGSPLIAHSMLRAQDRLIACELEPKAFRALARNLRDPRVKTLEVDGWTALSAALPPKERRGLVMLDPPFEQGDDYARLARGLAEAHRKWASGIFLLWYPIKGRPEPDRLAKSLKKLAIARILRAELTVAPLSDPSRLNGCGVILVTPPWSMEAELSMLWPALAQRLVRSGKAGFRLDWLAQEDPA
jgi:23S rRNA (adenine2030-N6)-methyltransferase